MMNDLTKLSMKSDTLALSRCNHSWNNKAMAC